MSINVTINGNPVCVRPSQMFLSDTEQIKKNERERRRRLRLEQVGRCQTFFFHFVFFPDVWRSGFFSLKLPVTQKPVAKKNRENRQIPMNNSKNHCRVQFFKLSRLPPKYFLSQLHHNKKHRKIHKLRFLSIFSPILRYFRHQKPRKNYFPSGSAAIEKTVFRSS